MPWLCHSPSNKSAENTVSFTKKINIKMLYNDHPGKNHLISLMKILKVNPSFESSIHKFYSLKGEKMVQSNELVLRNGT